MSLAKVFCSWSIAAVLLLLSISFSNSAKSEKPLDSEVSVDSENGEEGNATKSNITLTGNPQIDYIHDPNLPRELNGWNLSDYPFYSRVPKNINFSCDGRKDGFYASVEHKCQIYHHCLFGTRFDFLCANYTAFDQRTFICQFVSDVDCPNSHMYFHRNNALYVSKSTTTVAPVYDRSIYGGRRPSKKTKSRLRPGADDDGAQEQRNPPAPSTSGGEDTAVEAPPPKKASKDEDYYEDDYEDDYEVRRPARPRRRFRKCRNGRRRGRRCRQRGRRPLPYYYDEEDYAYDDDYDYAYYDDARPKKAGGKKRRPLNAISAGTSQVTSTSSSETPVSSTTSQLTTTTTTTISPPPSYSSTSTEMDLGPLDSEAIAGLQRQREQLFTKSRSPTNSRLQTLRPSRQDKPRFGSGSTSTTSTSTTTTERTRPPPTTTTTTTTSTTTEPPQYIYDYEYYEDDTPTEMSSTTTSTTTVRPIYLPNQANQPYFRGKIRSGNNAAALLEKQRVQQSIQVRVTEDQGTNTNTIRRRDNSNVQTPTRVATPAPPVSTSSTHHSAISSTTAPSSTANRPARFWQRKSTVKSISSTTAPSTTTTTLAPYYQEYQDYEDMAPDPQPSQPSLPPQQSSKFQPLLNPQHQYGTSPAGSSHRQSYGSTTGPSVAPPQQHYATSPRGHSASSLSSSSYAPPARPNKNYAMQQYSQSSSNSNSNSNSNNNNNYNTNSYHRQRSPSPPSVVPKPEFISLVDEDYNNPYVTAGGGGGQIGGPTSPSSASRYSGGGGSSGVGGGGGGGSYQHPIRFFEQHQPPAFLFGSASEYNSPRFAFPPRTNTYPPSPSNFQPYGHSTRRFSPHHIFK